MGNDKKGKPIYEEVGIFKTIGIYSGENTASELFGALAQSYIIKENKKKVKEVNEQIEAIVKRLSK